MPLSRVWRSRLSEGHQNRCVAQKEAGKEGAVRGKCRKRFRGLIHVHTGHSIKSKAPQPPPATHQNKAAWAAKVSHTESTHLTETSRGKRVVACRPARFLAAVPHPGR